MFRDLNVIGAIDTLIAEARRNDLKIIKIRLCPVLYHHIRSIDGFLAYGTKDDHKYCGIPVVSSTEKFIEMELK